MTQNLATTSAQLVHCGCWGSSGGYCSPFVTLGWKTSRRVSDVFNESADNPELCNLAPNLKSLRIGAAYNLLEGCPQQHFSGTFNNLSTSDGFPSGQNNSGGVLGKP